MAAANFPTILAFVLKQEGGWVDDPRDPGGATNLGVTLKTLRAYRHGATKDDLRRLSMDDAASRDLVASIYNSRYWDVVCGDELPGGVDAMVMDFAVNAGTNTATVLLQRLVGAAPNGRLGPRTLAAVARSKSTDLIVNLGTAQRTYYRELSTFNTFGRGWLDRTSRRVGLAISLATPPVATSTADTGKVNVGAGMLKF